MFTTQTRVGPIPSTGREFVTTHWSRVLAAGETTSPASEAALGELCQLYWYPIYAYVRRKGKNPEEAQDITQGFFAEFLHKGRLRIADPARGKFRTFLLTSLKNFMSDEWDRASAQKRGGGGEMVSLDMEDSEERYVAEPVTNLDPEALYERKWAVTLLDQAMARLEAEFGTERKRKEFEKLHPLLLGGSADNESYAEIGAALGMSEGAIKVAVFRLRGRFREIVREQITRTVGDPGDVEEELRYLSRVLAG